MAEPSDLAGFAPIEDCYGVPWRYSAECDMWYSPNTVFDWADLRGWHPEVIDAWVARDHG